jgi:phage tail protein X
VKTLEAIVEDAKGNVVGAVLSDSTEIRLPTPFPRAELAARARALAAAYGVTLPDNPAIPPAEPADG